MKTTIDISDSLLSEAKSVAVEEKSSVKALVEEGLRKVLSERKDTRRFRLRKASVKGKGLQNGIEEGSWERLRELIYEGRGA